MGRYLGYMMVPFFGGCDTLKEVPQAIQDRWRFWAHSWQLKGYSGFTDLINNLSKGVAYGFLHTLVWIFEYVTDWPFAGPKDANFWDIKKFTFYFDPPNFGILSHKLAQICINMWIYGVFFASSVQAMAIWVFWQKINHPFMAWRVNICNGMSFGNL